MTLNIAAIDVAEASLSAPDITLLSTQSVDGTGAFDVLMKTTKLHLLEEYNAGRITGEEYATVYLGAMTSVLQQAVQFLLNHQQAEKVLAEIGLVRQKTVTELAQTDDTLPEGLGFNGTTAVEGLVADQKALNALQESLVTAQISKAERDVALVGQQIITELAQTDDNIGTAASAYGLNDTASILGIVKAQVDKLGLEGDLLVQRLVTELAQTSDTKPLTLGQTSSTSITGLMKIQKDKALAEIDLLQQQTATEVSQTSNTKPSDLGQMASTEINGLSKAQRDKIDAEISRIAAEENLIIQKTVTEVAQTSDTKPLTLGAMSSSTAIEGLVQLQKDKTAAEISKLETEEDLIVQKLVTEVAQTSDTKPIDLGQISTTALTGISLAQKNQIIADTAKTAAEEDLLIQKTVTELAQTSDTKPLTLGAINDSTEIEGLVQLQKDRTLAEINKFEVEEELIIQKLVTELAQTSDTKPLDLGQMSTTAIDGLMKLQREQSTALISKMGVEEDLLVQQLVTEVAQTSDTKPTALGQMSSTSVISGLVAAQKDKIAAEIAAKEVEGDLITQKLVTELAQTSDSKPSDLGMGTNTTIAGLSKAQKDKIAAEVTLLAQKAITELAQTSDTVVIDTDALNTVATVTGVISKQKALFENQTKGFKRDAEQKLAKIMADSWAVACTIHGAEGTSTNKLDDPNVGSVIGTAIAGLSDY
jgi:hypothetical protein